jgi:hypothetical protein
MIYRAKVGTLTFQVFSSDQFGYLEVEVAPVLQIFRTDGGNCANCSGGMCWQPQAAAFVYVFQKQSWSTVLTLLWHLLGA